MRSRKKRIESMVGIHMDFHAEPNARPICEKMYPETFIRLLDEMRPDYMQCDTKGHPGYSSYPTNIGTRAPGMKCDILKELRRITAERGIALFAHHSGVYDECVVRAHPDWAVISEDGEVSTKFVSVFSPYADQILIPQLKEIAVDYDLDGAWIDGDCWAEEVDYSRYAREAWKQRTGKSHCPRTGEEGLEEYREFCRRGFRDYVRHYITEVKAVRPDFQITSNWIYSAHMPEKPMPEVEFLSGDFSPMHALSSGRFHGRLMMAHGLPWDLMSWGVSSRTSRYGEGWPTENRSLKEANQLCQEAAEVISLGGGYQFVIHQFGGGGIATDWAGGDFRAIAEFCRSREPFCYHAEPVPQTAVLFSDAASKFKGKQILLGNSSELSRCVTGLFDLCANTQLTTNAILSYQLEEGKLADYGLLMVPDTDLLEESVKSAVVRYVENGGKVLLCGPRATDHFSDEFGISIEPMQNKKRVCLEYNGRLACYMGNAADFTDLTGWDTLFRYREDNTFIDEAHPAIVSRKFKTGVVCATCFDLGDLYSYNMTTLIRELTKALFDILYPERIVRVEGSMYAEPVIMKKDGYLTLNLINSIDASDNQNVRSYSEIPAIGPLKVALRTEQKPQCVIRQPENEKVPFSWEDGWLRFTVDRLEIHSVFQILP
ncbi:MAG: hypothetical protein IJJ23_03390 [Clostridia bacterium]|nr:hypothetical protein [Clostridia bacterium]